ncbi:uncharacterized protein JCM10292_000787 [Rhodotorula paludigena]|uniref:uncharacterized protein n=1 Tax=Rhodotorula paludigena TaxID=86838 RepID=UPI00317E77ED
MAAVLSSPTPSLPSSSAPFATPPLLPEPEIADHPRIAAPAPPTARPEQHDHAAGAQLSSSPSSSSAGGSSAPSTPNSSISSTAGAHGSLVPAYPYNVAMASAAFSGGPLPDDSEVTTRLPSICVDYLSHDWAEDDVWTSWKAMTRHKSEIANGVRLENASWRTWAKQRGKLKTVSPETLNWLKDSDVTWLYGPLHTAVDAVPPPRIASANERLGLESLRPLNPDASKSPTKSKNDSPSKENQKPDTGPSPAAVVGAVAAASARGQGGPPKRTQSLSGRRSGKKQDFIAKPILKYRSLSDILMPQGQPTSPVIEQLGMDFEDQATISVHHARSDSHLVRLNSLNRKGSNSKRSSPIHSPGSSSPERTASDSSSAASNFLRKVARKKERRHIAFNHRVEQCIAIDSSEEARSYSAASSSESDDEDDVLTFGARSPRHSSFARPLAPKEPHTIARLGPTTLKSVELYPAPSPAVVFSSDPNEQDDLAGGASPPTDASGAFGQEHVETTSPYGQAQQQAGQRVMYDYSTPGSAIRSQWDAEDEDDYAMGFDYFTGSSGPDVQLGDEYDMAQYGSTHLIGGSHNNYRGGSVDQGGNTYLGSGPYSPTSPYHPGSHALDPNYHATQQQQQIPHYRDSLPATAASPASSSSSSGASSAPTPSTSTSPQVATTAQRGPHAPATSSRDAAVPKRSALKGGRSREASSDSTTSSASTSPASSHALSSPSLSSTASAPSSPTGIQAVATAIPAHVRPGVVRRPSDDGERGRSASRGSSSSLEREASANRRSSSSISPTSYSVSPTNHHGSSTSLASQAGASAQPIAIQPTWKAAGSYDSLSSVMNGDSGRNSSYPQLPVVPEGGSIEGQQPQAGLGRLITSSSVDSMGSLGSFGAGPITPTSPTFSMASPARRYQHMAGDDDEDDARVEDVAAVPATVDDSAEAQQLPKASDRPPPPTVSVKPAASSPSAPPPAPAPAPAPAATLGHGRTPSGPRLRNSSPSIAAAETSSEEAHAPSPAEEGEHSPLGGPGSASPTSGLDTSASAGPGLLKRSPSSGSLSYARQSLLRATAARDDSASRSSLDGSSPALSAGRASFDSSDAGDELRQQHQQPYDGAAAAGEHDDLSGAGVGAGINVAGTARDLLGAISKGIWGSLGSGSGSSRSSR